MPVKRRATKTTTSRRVHSVSARLSVTRLSRAGTALTLDIHGADGKLGELEIGRGALYWTGRNQREAKRISWTRFADMLDDLAGSNLRARRARE